MACLGLPHAPIAVPDPGMPLPQHRHYEPKAKQSTGAGGDGWLRSARHDGMVRPEPRGEVNPLGPERHAADASSTPKTGWAREGEPSRLPPFTATQAAMTTHNERLWQLVCLPTNPPAMRRYMRHRRSGWRT
jgi:hypothetical protein